MKRVLVVGGAGYIGSHMVKYLHEEGVATVTFDNLCTGHRDAVRYGHFVQGDLADRAALAGLFREHSFDGVMHFASDIEVGRSVIEPESFYQNNLVNTLNLLGEMRAAGVNRFIFSSTAAVYGNAQAEMIPETSEIRPVNPYGKSKAMIESILDDYAAAYHLRSYRLRYFNAAGADFDGELGERHEPETHLIPLAIRASEADDYSLKVFGSDYPTTDGTAVRDYVHVVDLCRAHFLALERLCDGAEGGAVNLGSGVGFTVLEVIDAVQRVTGRRPRYQHAGRRDGDPARLVADISLARDELGWTPAYSGLDQIVETASRFFEKAR